MSEYQISAQARLDIQLIWNWIAEDNIDAADKLMDELSQAMNLLANMPGLGHEHRDVRNPRTRFWSVHPYLIAYLPNTSPIQIVRVVHGARNIKKLFRKK